MNIEERFYVWLFDDGHTLLKIFAFYAVIGIVYIIGTGWSELYEWFKEKLKT